MCIEHGPTGWLNAHYAVSPACISCRLATGYIDTVIVEAEHVSIGRNPSETGCL